MKEDLKQNEPVKGTRLESLDALRGFDMFFITGGSGVLIALGNLIYGSPDNWLAVQMEHVDWAGFHFLDLIFALFLFLAGTSWPFSLASRRARGLSDLRITLGILRRFAILFVLGAIMFRLLGFDFAHVRFNSILGRIGFGWAVAAFGTLYLSRKGNWVFAAFCFFGYWAAQQFLPLIFSPGQDPWGAGCFQAVFDKWLGGRVPDKWGPEGFFQAFGCISSAYLGVFAGQILKDASLSGGRKTVRLFIWAAVLGVGAGLAYLAGCPCIKNMWNPGYILLAGSISFALMGAFYWIIDVRGWRKWAFFFKVIGMNAITIYLLQWAWSFHTFSKKVFGGTAGLLPEAWGALVLAVGAVLLRWLVLLFLYRHKIFLRV